MENFLLDPNLAYMLIVVGFLLTVFAILSPGTGLFEAGALVILALVGYQVYNLPINMWALGLLLGGLVTFILAVRERNEKLNLALTALLYVVGSAYFFRLEGADWYIPVVHPGLAGVVSIMAGGFFWLVTTKALEARGQAVSHDLGAVIGAVGETRTKVHHEGSVQVQGEAWTARSEKPIKSGAIVKVTGRQGFVLDVKEVKDAD